MNRLVETLRGISQQLKRSDRAWALVGGLAVSVRTEPRFTRDVDVAVAVASDREAERLVGDLQSSGYRLFQVIEQDATGRLATARLLLPGADEQDTVVDLLFASSGIEPEVVAAAEPIEVFPSIVAPIPRIGHLIALKLLSESEQRLKDRVDLQALLAFCDNTEVDLAREAARLITERGYHRGRDLLDALDTWIAKAGAGLATRS